MIINNPITLIIISPVFGMICLGEGTINLKTAIKLKATTNPTTTIKFKTTTKLKRIIFSGEIYKIREIKTLKAIKTTKTTMIE